MSVTVALGTRFEQDLLRCAVFGAADMGDTIL